jgi:hypothetical protein
MKKLIGGVSTAIIFVFILSVQVNSVQAADQVVNVTITEAQLSQRVVELVNASGDPNTNASAVIEEGRLALNGKVVFKVNGEQKTTDITFSYKIVPFVSNGKIACRFTALQIGNRFATPEELRYINTDSTNEACNQLFSPFLSAYPNARVRRIILHNHIVTIQLTQVGEAIKGGCTVTTTTNVNLRSGPSASSALITAVPTGTTLSVIGTQGNWLEVSYNNAAAWVYAPLVTSTGGCK